MDKQVLLRPAGGTIIGSGHVMRCLALAQAWGDQGGTSLIILDAGLEVLSSQIRSEKIDTLTVNTGSGTLPDACEVIRIGHKTGAKWIVLDGYVFTSEYLLLLKQSGFQIMVIDDFAMSGKRGADVVLNQNLHAEESQYLNGEQHTRLLFGTKYVLLRQEFLAYRNKERSISAKAHKIIVTFGGSDPNNVTELAVKALNSISKLDFEVKVIVGLANTRIVPIRNLITESRHSMQLVVGNRDMSGTMAWADMAISAGGTTSWELVFMRVPSIVIVTSENQTEIAASLERKGIALNAGWYSNLSEKTLSSMIENLALNFKARDSMKASGERIVDGFGAYRVAKCFKNCDGS